MSAKNQKIFLKVFFSLLFIFSVFKIYDNTVSRDAWQYGEWLINYQGGFTRRGLVGEILVQINYFLNFKIRNLVFIFEIILLFTYYFYIINLFKKIDFSPLLILIIFYQVQRVYN